MVGSCTSNFFGQPSWSIPDSIYAQKHELRGGCRAKSGASVARSRNIYLWTIGYHHRLRHGAAPGRTDFDGSHGKYRAVAVAPANERTAAHALVTTRRSSDAEGSDRDRQWDARAGSRCR